MKPLKFNDAQGARFDIHVNTDGTHDDPYVATIYAEELDDGREEAAEIGLTLNQLSALRGWVNMRLEELMDSTPITLNLRPMSMREAMGIIREEAEQIAEPLARELEHDMLFGSGPRCRSVGGSAVVGKDNRLHPTFEITSSTPSSDRTPF